MVDRSRLRPQSGPNRRTGRPATRRLPTIRRRDRVPLPRGHRQILQPTPHRPITLVLGHEKRQFRLSDSSHRPPVTAPTGPIEEPTETTDLSSIVQVSGRAEYRVHAEPFVRGGETIEIFADAGRRFRPDHDHIPAQFRSVLFDW